MVQKETPATRDSLDHQGPSVARVNLASTVTPDHRAPGVTHPTPSLPSTARPTATRSVQDTNLWNRFSLIFTDGNDFDHGQDLGAPGSCLRMFNPVPLMMCNRHTDGRCDYNFRNEYSYWLASQLGDSDQDIPEGTEVAYVPRCTVCEIDTPTLTIHSQSNETAPCPPTWVPLWKGYSYLMVNHCHI